MRWRPVVAGLGTRVPGLFERLRGGTGGTTSASYCYGVWLKHLSFATDNGLPGVPRTLAELGPGDSLGVGLAALLSGAERYYAFDVLTHAHNERNLQVFDELVEMFRERRPTPDADGWPDVRAAMGGGLFPAQVLTDEHLDRCLDPARVLAIRQALTSLGTSDDGSIEIRYVVPWDDDQAPSATVDLLLSHSVLEHVTDLPSAYASMHRWLRPGGMVSHQVDFGSHALADAWNGQWSFSDLTWWAIAGNRPYLLNRQPCSVHVAGLADAGLQPVCELRNVRPSDVPRHRLARRFRSLSEQDLTCTSAFLQSVKPASVTAST